MRDSTKKIISNAQVRVALVSPRAVTKVNCRLGPGAGPKKSRVPKNVASCLPLLLRSNRAIAGSERRHADAHHRIRERAE